MIMFCMNCVSAAECGGKVARVDAGKARVGWPGAPGWTTTGASCAETDSDKKHVSEAAATSPLRKNATLISVRSLCLAQKCLITNGFSPHSLTEALRSSSSADQFIQQVGRNLHGATQRRKALPRL